uniref:Uncharacterized protein n=2 Tax=Caenorhabditis japonica TaxID=281687 RepID=A0A8R1IV82_CAEJA
MKLKVFKQEENGTNKKMSRKEMRTSAKKLKKMQARAFAQRAPIESVMREDMKMTKEDKKKRKRKRQREAKKEMKMLEKQNESEQEDGDSDEEEEDQNPAKRRRAIVEVSVNKGKRKYGDESEDSDDDLTYEQYLEQVEEAKRKRRADQDGLDDDDAAIRKYGVLLGMNENKKERDGTLKFPRMHLLSAFPYFL